MQKKNLLFLCGILMGTGAFSQDVETSEGTGVFSQAIETSAELHVMGLASTGDGLPFWMHSNQRGRVYEDTNLSTWLNAKASTYLGENSFFEVGAGILYRDEAPNELTADELYLHFETSWLRATVGRKHRPVLYNGLSASNESILWSLNARPLPGLQVGTNGTIFLTGDRGLGFDASWNEYLLGDERYMEDARLHHKSFHLVYRTENELQIKAGVRHFAHWGGSPPDGREHSFTQNYWDAVTLEHPSQHHLSSYEINISQDFEDYRLEFLYNHIAVDRSGRRMENFPDGRYGIFYEDQDQNRIVNSVIYEFYYTRDQNYDSGNWPGDDYFNHFVYRSGWAYQGKIIGTPFFTYDRGEEMVTNNIFTTHHLGIGGQFSTVFRTYPYRLLLNLSRNEGTYDNRFVREENMFSTYFDMRVFQSFVDVNVQLGTEFGTHSSPNFGAGVNLVYRL